MAIAAAAALCSAAGAARIAATDAKDHVGETVWVCGHVSQVAVKTSSKTGQGMTFLNFGFRYPWQVFSAVFLQPDRSFGDLRGVERKNCCVKGTIQLFRNQPQIVVTTVDQLYFWNNYKN